MWEGHFVRTLLQSNSSLPHSLSASLCPSGLPASLILARRLSQRLWGGSSLGKARIAGLAHQDNVDQ